MSTTQTMDAGDAVGGAVVGHAAATKKGGKKLIMIGGAVVALLCAAGGGAYFLGLFGKSAQTGEAAAAPTPGAIDLPEIVANLNAGNKRTAFVRVKARLELASKATESSVIANVPRIQDLFQTYLRDMRPEELRGSAGTYRLREELLARVNIAIAPARAIDILLIELLVQ